MFAYYFQLGLRSLRRSPALTALMVMAVGFGVAASMTTYSVFRAVSGNPIPDKSAQLFTPQVDSWGPQQNEKGEPADALNYIDAIALMRAPRSPIRIALWPGRETYTVASIRTEPSARSWNDSVSTVAA